MCGIFGILTPNPEEIDPGQINLRLRHCGPDDSRTFIGDGVALSATHLSTIDVIGGHQPLSNESSTVWLVCNGEVVNGSELRTLLEGFGHQFKTRLDIETIIHGYEEWGEDVVCKLRGMFAFGLWDSNASKLFLARDRFGIKPLSYIRQGERFVFSSEINPLLEALPEFPRKPNLEALWRLFEIGHVPTPLTPFQGIFRLPAAHYMRVTGTAEEMKCYWKPVFPHNGDHSSINFSNAADDFIEHVLEALNAWRMRDVPVGSLLSGGIDSSSICALMAEISPEPIHTFTLGFNARSLDESRLARETAKHIGSQHHEIHFRLDSMGCLPTVIQHLEQPHHSVTTSLYRIFQACNSAGFKVVMSGEGADELLGGYNWYRMDQELQHFMRLNPIWRNVISRMPVVRDRDKRFVLRNASQTIPSRFICFQRGLRPADISALLFSPTFPSYDGYLSETYAEDLRDRHPFDQMLFIESRTRLVDYINHGLDRVSMANSVEARPVFLDHKLWEYTAQLPPDYKLTEKGNKYLLRYGMRDRLPEEVINRRKKGLTSPVTAWFRKPRLPDWAEECLTKSVIDEAVIFNSSEVARLLSEHRSGQDNHSNTLVQILTTQIWRQIFIKQQGFNIATGDDQNFYV